MYRIRGIVALSALAAIFCSAASAVAQDSTSAARVCLNHPQPGPTCSVIFLTNIGGYYRIGGADGSQMRAVADWGVLVPAGGRSAVGASVFVSLESPQGAVGAAVRYRHWSKDTKSSWEVAAGLPLYGEHTLAHGLFKWNVSRVVGIAIRPELRRTFTYASYPECLGPPNNCVTHGTSGAVSFGVEIGGVPGLALTAASVVGLFAAVLGIKD